MKHIQSILVLEAEDLKNSKLAIPTYVYRFTQTPCEN